MTIVRTTRIDCNGRRHLIELHDDGSVTCPDHPAAVEHGHGAAMLAQLGRRLPDRAGCAQLVALVSSVDLLVPVLDLGAEGETVWLRDPGAWTHALRRYQSNNVFRRAWFEAQRRVVGEAGDLHKLVFDALAKCKYWLQEGSGGFARVDETPERLLARTRIVFDVPEAQLDGYVVSNFNGDRWELPIQNDWRVTIYDGQLAILGGKLVVGRSMTEPRVVYVVVGDSGKHRVRAHVMNPITREIAPIPRAA